MSIVSIDIFPFSFLIFFLYMRGNLVQLCLTFITVWTVAHQPPLSMGFSRQKYWNGLPCPPLGNLPNSGIEPMPLTSPALAGKFFTSSATWEAQY